MQKPRYPHFKKDRQPVKVERANKSIRKGDIVQVISGREAASKKTGKVLRIITSTNRCIVEKVNMVKRHRKPTQKNAQGGIEEIESSIHLSNVRFISRGEGAKSAKKEKKAATPKAEKAPAKKKAAKGK